MPAKAACVWESAGGGADPCAAIRVLEKKSCFLELWHSHPSVQYRRGQCDYHNLLHTPSASWVVLVTSPRAPLLYHLGTELVTTCHLLKNSQIQGCEVLLICLPVWEVSFCKRQEPTLILTHDHLHLVFTFLRQPSEDRMKNRCCRERQKNSL